MGEKQVESVYCDFTKLPTDAGKNYAIDASLKICLKNYLHVKFIDEWNYKVAYNCFAGFETQIGYVDVKSSPVYFYVQRSATFNVTKTPIPFDTERLNVGGAMNVTSGKFTAPRDGTYAFSFTGDADFLASSSRTYLNVIMYLHGNQIAKGFADEVGSTALQSETSSFQSTLNLEKGDEIWLEIYSMSITGTYLVGGYYTHFSGYLLEENIAVA